MISNSILGFVLNGILSVIWGEAAEEKLWFPEVGITIWRNCLALEEQLEIDTCQVSSGIQRWFSFHEAQPHQSTYPIEDEKLPFDEQFSYSELQELPLCNLLRSVPNNSPKEATLIAPSEELLTSMPSINYFIVLRTNWKLEALFICRSFLE